MSKRTRPLGVPAPAREHPQVLPHPHCHPNQTLRADFLKRPGDGGRYRERQACEEGERNRRRGEGPETPPNACTPRLSSNRDAWDTEEEGQEWKGPEGASSLPGGNDCGSLLRTGERYRTLSCPLALRSLSHKSRGRSRSRCAAICRGSWEQVPAGQEAGPGDLRVLANLGFQGLSTFSRREPVGPGSQQPCPGPRSIPASNQRPEPQTEREAVRTEAPSRTPALTASCSSQAGRLGQGGAGIIVAGSAGLGRTEPRVTAEKRVSGGGWRSAVAGPYVGHSQCCPAGGLRPRPRAPGL